LPTTRKTGGSRSSSSEGAATSPASHGPAADAIANAGERVTHLYPNDLYVAHLSLYEFAAGLAREGGVLDAGCGSGYGSAHLATRGAREVLGIDVDPDAIAFCRRHHPHARVRFRVLDVADVGSLGDARFDLVISSNTLEHVPRVGVFLHATTRLLAPGGALVVAVPPVEGPRARLREMSNPYHLNIWSPAQWRHTLDRYFAEVQAYRHTLASDAVAPDFLNRPEDVTIDVADFAFVAVPPGDALGPSLTALFVARSPFGEAKLPPPGAAPELVDDSFTRRRPVLPPLPPEQLAAEVRPIGALPARALRLWRRGGARGVLREARRSLVWRLRRARAVRALPDSDDT